MSRSEEDTPCPHCDGAGQRVYSVFTALSKGIGTISTRHSPGRGGATATVVQDEPADRAAEAPLEVEALVLRSFEAVHGAATSERWVAALAGELRAAYGSDPSVRVVQRGSDESPELGDVALPVDIAVWRAGSNAVPGDGGATYVREVLWQVAVELGEGPRETPARRCWWGRSTPTSILNTLQRAAAACSGQLFLALVPLEGGPDAAPRMWRFRGGRWNLYPG